MFLPVAIGLLATFLSILMFKVENMMGIWQRMIFVCSFGWLLYEFSSNTALRKGNTWTKGLFVVIVILSALKLLLGD